jgi:xanthine dehydrogenase YagS FAD-binding subunit
MNSFEYATPATVEEAVKLLGARWGETEVLAGGADLVTSLKQGITTPKRVVSLKAVEDLKGIKVAKGKLTIGAMTIMGELAANADVQKHFPALSTAAQNIASPQILSTGTVGGDICQRPRCWYFRNGHGVLGQANGQSLVANGDNRYHAIFGNAGAAKFVSASSLGPALIALGATITTSARTIAANKFFATPKEDTERETVLMPNEIVTTITVPMKGLNNATYEIRHRKGLDWPYATASVAFENGGDVRVVLGHVAPVPWIATRTIAAPAKVNEQFAIKVGDAAAQGATPLSGNVYKVQMVKTAVKRAVLAAAGN